MNEEKERTERGNGMDGLSIGGFCLVACGILTVVWGATKVPVSLMSPDFMSFATGGIVPLAAGLCMVGMVPPALRVAGIWLAALTTMAYVYSLPGMDLMVKFIGFVPAVALGVWLTLRLWK